MSRYYFHLRQGTELHADEEGAELPDLAAARAEALNGLRSLLGEAMRFGDDVKIEALIIADEEGQQLAAIPVIAALPPSLLERIQSKPADVEAMQTTGRGLSRDGGQRQ